MLKKSFKYKSSSYLMALLISGPALTYASTAPTAATTTAQQSQIQYNLLPAETQAILLRNQAFNQKEIRSDYFAIPKNDTKLQEQILNKMKKDLIDDNAGNYFQINKAEVVVTTLENYILNSIQNSSKTSSKSGETKRFLIFNNEKNRYETVEEINTITDTQKASFNVVYVSIKYVSISKVDIDKANSEIVTKFLKLFEDTKLNLKRITTNLYHYFSRNDLTNHIRSDFYNSSTQLDINNVDLVMMNALNLKNSSIISNSEYEAKMSEISILKGQLIEVLNLMKTIPESEQSGFIKAALQFFGNSQFLKK